jgi:hypothetical protein
MEDYSLHLLIGTDPEIQEFTGDTFFLYCSPLY